MKKSTFAIHKALIGMGGEPKSAKRLRSGDLIIETSSALQTKSFLLANSFLDSPLTISPHKLLNTSRGGISEPDLLSTPETKILDGFSDQGVIQVRRITIKKDNTIIPTKHLIVTFNSPKLLSTIKAAYLNCKIRPYILNPLRCFKCQRFGHHKLPAKNNCLALEGLLLDILPQNAIWSQSVLTVYNLIHLILNYVANGLLKNKFKKLKSTIIFLIQKPES
ncbi:uncharacterized protein TNCV_4862341 [Trichonephila clavipes]|nr:uncharacterized protein TNCV_4862341 [Trichonephila clavipes]